MNLLASRILVVDDFEAARVTVKTCCYAIGIKDVDGASDGIEAFTLID